MTIPLSNIAEGGTNTTTVSQGSGGNSGGASGDYFDIVSIGAGEALTFSSTTSATGALSYLLTTTSPVVANYLQYGAQLGTLTTNQSMKVTWYWRAPGVPTSSVRMMQILNGVTVLCGVNHASGTGDVAMTEGTTTLAPQTGTGLTANTWYRIEAILTGIGTSSGSYTVAVYVGTSTTLLGNVITASNRAFGAAAPDTLRIGITTANATVSTSYQLDDITVSVPPVYVLPTFNPVPFVPVTLAA